MSISLAETWVRATLRSPQAQSDTLRFLDQALSQGAEATLIVGPKLTTNGRCYFGRWDGRELVVLELTAEQQRDWQVEPSGVFHQIEPRLMSVPVLSSKRLVSITVEQTDIPPTYDGTTPISGNCVAEKDDEKLRLDGRCALRAEYFRPDLPRPITSMWYEEQFLTRKTTKLHYRFPPLFSSKNPKTYRGSVIMFLQLFIADSWSVNVGCHRISNVAHVAFTVR